VTGDRSGVVENSARLRQEIEALGFRPIFRDSHADFYVSDAGFVDVAYRGRRNTRVPNAASGKQDTQVYVSAFEDTEVVERAKKALWPLIKKKGVEREIFVLATSQRGLYYLPIGFAGIPLERENYSDKVLTEYDRVVAEFRRPEPSGRFVLVEGAPGVGKTFLVRALVQATPGRHIVVPPELVGKLGDPSLIGAVVEEAEGATTFILEDADSALIPRGSDNMASIASLLNLGDGLLGRILDLRVVATTNAKKNEVEPALLRSGRLLSRIEIPALDRSQAARIYKRLTGAEDLVPANGQTLADVYARAYRDHPPEVTEADDEPIDEEESDS